MRPCRKCGHAIANNITICPSCNHAQDERCRTPAPEERNSSETRERESRESDPRDEFVLLVMGIIAFSLILGGCRLCFGEQGWTIGFVVSLVLFTVFRFLVFL